VTGRSRRAFFASLVRPALEPLPEPTPPEALAEVLPEADEDAPPPWERRARALAEGRPDSVARVLAFACLGGSPSFCSTCIEHCPVPGALQLTARAPRVDASLCDGCGACERVCPAPERAIVVLPRTPPTDARKR
jgi:ferredoxin